MAVDDDDDGGEDDRSGAWESASGEDDENDRRPDGRRWGRFNAKETRKGEFGCSGGGDPTSSSSTIESSIRWAQE